MLSIGAASGGQGQYYVDLAQPDYYLEGGEPPGRWTGEGAKALGLSGLVEREDFLRLYAGYLPDGSAGVQNAGKENRQPGWDLTFSAPKSVSVLWSQADELTRIEIEAAQQEAVKKVIKEYIEPYCAFTRRGKRGTEQEKVGLVVGTFQHGTSRGQDPQLHTHAFVLGIAPREDGTLGTIESRPFYQNKMAIGALYRSELAKELEERLGVRTVREKSWFEVVGVPQELIDEFSKRRQEIEAALDARGQSSAAAAAVAALDTRSGKESIPRSELFYAWHRIGDEHGFSEEQVRGLCGHTFSRDLEAERTAALEKAVETLTRQNSHFKRSEIIRQVAEEAQGRGLGITAVVQGVEQYLNESPEIVKLPHWQGHERFTTREMLKLERELLARVEESRGNGSHRVQRETVEEVLSRRPTITKEQAEAVRHITLESGSVQVVSGMAGTGKTFMLDAAREAWEAEGYTVIGASLAGKAARGLESGAKIKSDTIHKTLGEIDRGRLVIEERTIVVVDEAGMVGTRMMDDLSRAVLEHGGKLVLVGDAQQLQPIEAGGPFLAIGRSLGQAELSEITRQREKWAVEAVKDFAQGKATSALEAYAERGFLHVADDRKGAMRELIDQWKERGVSKPGEHLIFVGENKEAQALNRMAQDERKAKGELGKESLRVGSEDFYDGDRILFTRNSRMLGVRNGDLATVIEIKPGEQMLTARLDNGAYVTVPLADYDHLRLGYAMTTHKGQGVTCENAYILAGGPMQDRHITYVQASRARGETRLFVDRIEAGIEITEIARRMEQERMKELASEIIRQAIIIQQQQQQQQQQNLQH